MDVRVKCSSVQGSRNYDFASYNFTVSATFFRRLFLPVTVSASPVMRRKENGVARSILPLQANTAILTPSLVETLFPQIFPGLRMLIFCGEADRLKKVMPFWVCGKKAINNSGIVCML